MSPPSRHWLSATIVSAALIAAVTGVIALLDPGVPGLGLGVLYLFAVVPIGLGYGVAAAGGVSVASMLAFNYFFLTPTGSLDPGTTQHWAVLAAFLGSSLAIVEVAALSQRRARRSARLAEEQAALQRVATLVAGAVAPPELFAAVAREVGEIVRADATRLARCETDGTVTGVAAWSLAKVRSSPGTRIELEGDDVVGLVQRTGRPARVRSAVGAPIVVDDRLWGVVLAASTGDRELPADAEPTIARFADLVAAAIANAESRVRLARLAEEQAALRRVATLVARAAQPEELFAAVIEEVGRVVPAENAALARYETGDMMTVVAVSSGLADSFPVGSRWPIGGKNVSTVIFETGHSARIDDYGDATGRLGNAVRRRGMASAVGAPIIVEGRAWGLITAASTEGPLPDDSEARVASFTELVATAISNTEARTQVGRLADEQAALRRVATLVAHAVPDREIFGAVTEEAGRLLDADFAGMLRYEADGEVTPVAAWAAVGVHPVLPDRWSTGAGDPATLVAESRRTERVNDWSNVPGPIAAFIRDIGISSSIGSPILVAGDLWGAVAVHTRRREPLPADTEARLESFAELVATSIANAQARADVAASRARIVAATDEERRRVVRDLHDGAQQRMVHTVVTLKLAQQNMEHREDSVFALVTEALEHAEQGTVELRELAHGILPAALTRGGLRAGVSALASRMPVPVETDVSERRFSAVVEATAYFVIAEALTNVAKHAQAGRATVVARVEDDTFHVRVRDDGIGGARPDGSGFVGLADRLAALDGRLRVESPAGGGTVVAAEIPLPGGS